MNMSSSPRPYRKLQGSLPAAAVSPNNKKLQRSVYNQTSPGVKSNHYLRLRQINLTAPSILHDILEQCGPQASQVTHLDISYSMTNSFTLKILCSGLTQLQVLIAVECGLSCIVEDTPWPSTLQSIDFSRNQITRLPPNVYELFELTELNLSGNSISELDPSLLALSKLQKLHLLNNPIKNAPKSICREGVKELRQFFKVSPRPVLANIARKPLDLRRFVLHNRGSIDSGYESWQRTSSCGSASSFSDVDSINSVEDWPPFEEDSLPNGYTQAVKLSSLCQVYLPEGYDCEISIETVKDLSFHPQSSTNNLIISPVIRISPHGVQFPAEQPAIIVLGHCTQPPDSPHHQLRVTPLCSDTGPTDLPHWTELSTSETPQIFNDRVLFTTTHFSLFTVMAAVFSYPSQSILVSPNEYNLLEVQEIEGLKIEFPPSSVHSPSHISATAYFTDSSFTPVGPELSPATVCIGVEPHGLQFDLPVRVSLPLPHYTDIKHLLPNATLQLYHASHHNTYNGQIKWELVENKQYTINTQNGVTVISFETNHFSLFDFVWNVGQATLSKFGLGASYVYRHLIQSDQAATLSVQWQAFMTPPLRDLSFGLALCVYKFGEPLKGLSNFPWLVSEGKGVSLRIGELEISLQGHFVANQDVSETLDRTTSVVNFTGEDFSVRFDFALKLNEQLSLPLEDGQFLGKLNFIQANRKTASYNLHKVR